MSNTGDQFQIRTKYDRRSMPRTMLNWSSQPDVYKHYPDAVRVALPPALPAAHRSLHDCIRNRRSTRDFASAPMSIASLSYLLWASTGISRIEHGYEFRTAPSAGALYPIETYLCLNRVEGAPTGVHHYNVKGHHLEVLKEGDYATDVAQAALDQRMCISAAVVFIWTGVFQRSKWKYGQRAYRYVYLDAGHIAENLALAATGQNLGSCHIAAIYDDEANRVINVDGIEESVIYMTVVGPVTN